MTVGLYVALCTIILYNMYMSELANKPYYLLHTLVGYRGDALGPIFYDHNREWPPLRKMDVFLEAEPETPEGVTEAFGLDIREVMCTVSRRRPAVTYHSPYGLVLEGEVKACFDNDTGKSLQEDGTYSDNAFDFTHESTPEQLMGKWYKGFTRSSHFTWNEAILAKGSKVAGAFHDPRAKTMGLSVSDCRYPKVEYGQFLDKVQRCGLELLEITAKHGIYES